MKLNLAKIRDLKQFTAKEKEAIRRDLWTLLGRCDGALAQDGAGFNAYDAVHAREIADDLEAGRPINWEYLAKMLHKYRKTQLGGHDDY